MLTKLDKTSLLGRTSVNRLQRNTFGSWGIQPITDLNCSQRTKVDSWGAQPIASYEEELLNAFEKISAFNRVRKKFFPGLFCSLANPASHFFFSSASKSSTQMTDSKAKSSNDLDTLCPRMKK